MDILNNLDLLSVAVATAAILVLGSTVYFNNRRSITNRTFFYLSFAIIFWSTTNYVAYQFQSEILTLWFLRLVIFFSTWFAFFALTFLYVFPRDKIIIPLRYKIGFLSLASFVSILCLTPWVFNRILELSAANGASRVANGPGVILFGLTVLTFNLGGVISLFRKTLKTKKEERPPFQHVLGGIFITLALIVTFNFILPAFFDNPRFIPFGALFIFPFVAFTSYAILKHKLFNIRVAGTAVLVFLLAVVTFSEVILSHELSLIVYRSSVFLLVLVFGIVLIRGVLREVEQKERLQKLSDELAEANDKLKELDKAKTEFVSIASHQLRAPLTAIKGYASLILEGSFGEFSDKVKKAVDIIFQSSQKLVTVIEDFLNITRIELGRMKYEMSDFDFKKLVEGVVGELRPSIEKKGLALSFEAIGTDFTAHGDLGKLNQVINNLIDNATKYTPALSADGKEGSIKLTLAKAADSAHRVILTIKDTGVGIDQETMGRLFQKFTRADDAGKINITGTGLGLYVAKQIVEAHNGKLWAESEGVGKGSTFVVEL